MRHIIQGVAGTSAPWAMQGESGSAHAAKVIVVHGIDRLSSAGQASLRRILERCILTCRLVFTTCRRSRVHPAIQSRCIVVPVALPTEQALFDWITTDNQKHKGGLTPDWIAAIVKRSDRSIHKIKDLIRSAEVSIRTFGLGAARLAIPTWIKSLDQLVHNILSNPSMSTLVHARDHLIDILSFTSSKSETPDVAPIHILTTLVHLLWNRLGDMHAHMLSRRAALCLYELQVQGTPPLIVLESLIARVLAFYIAWSIDR